MMEEGIRPLPEKEKKISESKPQIKTLVLEKEAVSELAKKMEECILRSQKYLLAAQSEEGYWNSELLVDPLTICDYIILLHWLGISNPELEEKAAKHLLKEQHSDGGWGQYTGSPSNIDLSVKAYHILKIAGISERDPRMVRARATILRMGGIPKTNTYTKFYLALVGQFPWKYIPSIPTELMLLPNWFVFNIYELSSWTRAMVVSMSIINHFKPTRNLPPEHQINELYPYGTEKEDFSLPRDKKFFSWRNFFLLINRFLKFHDALSWKPLRKKALKAAENWMLERIGEGCDGLGAIFPSMCNTVMALESLGYSRSHPIYVKAMKDVDSLVVNDPVTGEIRVRPCFGPIWDTAICSVALAQSGLPSDHPSLQKAADWLLSKEVRQRGDWYVKNPYPECSGWAFEFNNVFYPDVDDTVKVLLGLRLMKASDEELQATVMDRAFRWALSFQCKEGGFAAFDKDVTKPWLEKVPFSDHNAILDPPCSDITGRMLEYIGKADYPIDSKTLKSILAYIKKTQEPDGSWYGRWGVNYIYGTWQALRGLDALKIDMNQDWIIRSRNWLESCQNPDGGWGETPGSYDFPSLKGLGISTATQTAWAVMGILSFGDPTRASIKSGIKFLTDTQYADGTWNGDQYTGTGFPKVYYMRYDYYRINWPLIALAEYQNSLKKWALRSTP
jgi:squalene-hopene/tetraprenyl-beta-curcumene cyclase